MSSLPWALMLPSVFPTVVLVEEFWLRDQGRLLKAYMNSSSFLILGQKCVATKWSTHQN